MRGDGVLLTGGRGYLGGRFLHDVPGVRALEADITDAVAVRRALGAAGPATTLLHLAGANELVCAADLARGFLVNAEAVDGLIAAAAEQGVQRVIFFSTFHVYGEPADGQVIDERTVPLPRHPYGITKLAGELVARRAAGRAGLSLAIVRLSNGVGAPANADIGRWSLVVLDLCRQAHEKGVLTLKSSGVQRRDFVAIDDIVAAVARLVDVEPEGLGDPLFNLGSGTTTSVREIAGMIADEYRSAYGEAVTIEAPPPDGRGVDFRYDVSRLEAIGLRIATDLRREIRATLAFCERFRPAHKRA
jgi:UDP-glucose 4-epimerase